MKRMFILFAIVSLVAGSLFADEAVLIDFTKLAVDIHVDDGSDNQDPNQNRQTLVDYSNAAGGTFTLDQKRLMKTSLAHANWEVILSSSSRTVGNQSSSFTRQAVSKQWESVLGVRVHFPVEPHNSWALIKPPFEIPAFENTVVDEEGTLRPDESATSSSPTRFEGTPGEDGKIEFAYGVVKNVGTIKSVAVNVYGLNFPHSLSAILIDGNGVEKTVFLGYLNFDGWGELRWDNPAYVSEVRNRDLRLYPLYPNLAPFIKFGGFLIQRDAAATGGDFVAYFKDVKIIYDKARLDTESDIDNETEWGIIKSREVDKDKFQLQRFGQTQVLRYVDKGNMATEPPFGDPSRNPPTEE